MLFKFTNAGVTTPSVSEKSAPRHLIEKTTFLNRKVIISMFSLSPNSSKVSPNSLLTKVLPKPFENHLLNEPVFFLVEGEEGEKIVSAKQAEKLFDLLILAEKNTRHRNTATNSITIPRRGRGAALQANHPRENDVVHEPQQDEEDINEDFSTTDDLTKSDGVSFGGGEDFDFEDEEEEDEMEDASADAVSRLDEGEDEEEVESEFASV